MEGDPRKHGEGVKNEERKESEQSVLINRWLVYLGLSLDEDLMRHHIDALSLTHLRVRRLGNVPTNPIPSSLIKGCPWTLIPVLSNMLLKLEKALRQRQAGA